MTAPSRFYRWGIISRLAVAALASAVIWIIIAVVLSQ